MAAGVMGLASIQHLRPPRRRVVTPHLRLLRAVVFSAAH
ncbi:Unknown protein sequence [Pseudomonas syringae pv. maculicola str. M6]|nr:Unknown protein sequence [Pseudomonas syringae pv. maculicola str. M6]